MNVAIRSGTAACWMALLGALPALAGETVLSFSGSDSYIDLGTPGVLQIPSEHPFTVEGWMALNALDSRDMLYTKNSARSSSVISYTLGFYDSGDLGAYSAGSGWVKCTPDTNIGTKRWYHVAFSYDGTNMSYYLDGQPFGSRPYTFANTESHSIQLGGSYSGADINGMKSDVRVWDHARTQQQIADDKDFRLSGDEIGLLGYWPLNDGAGAVVLDQTANASTGTIVNAVWSETDALTLLPATTPFRLAEAFTLADIETGNPAYTVSNEVDVTDFPVPEGYDLYQVTESGEAGAIDPGAWLPTNALPEILDFGRLATATNIMLHAWFTNSSEAVVLRRATGAIEYVTDVSDSVVDFFAPASYVSLGNPAPLQLAANHPLTVEGWVNFKSLNEYNMLWCKNNAARGSTYTYMFGLRAYGASLTAYTGAGGSPANTWTDIPLPAALQVDRWYHVAFTFDGTTLAGYIDGQKAGETAYSFGNTAAHTLVIGGYADANDPNALRSDVRFWDHARTAADIARYRGRRLSGLEPGLLGYWPLNDWSGTTVFDRTTNASTGMIVKATCTLSEGFALAPPPADFGLSSVFTLADIETGSMRFTNSNIVDLVVFPLPAGYDSYQMTRSGETSALDPDGWSPTNTIPAQLTFPRPTGDSPVVFYAWFTNSVTHATLLRSEGSIYYTAVPPAAHVRATLTRERMPGSNVVITASDIDLGSTGGEANGLVLEVVDRIALAADPGDDLTPGEPYVTLAAEGDYPLLLWLKNEAGNTTVSVATCLVSVVSYSGSNVWTGLGYTDLWSDAANWGAGVPVAGQEVIINAGTLRLTGATPELDSLVLGAGATLTFEGWESALQASDITIAGTVSHLPQTVTEPDPITGEWVPQHRIWFKGSNLTVTATGILNADYMGYLPNAGPGRALFAGGGYGVGGGGGHGGRGSTTYDGQPYGPTYGEPDDPWQPGSGPVARNNAGGIANSRPGGGAIRIELSGCADISGTLTARAQRRGGTHGAAGAGGSIAIFCRTFQGAATGLIRVDGGQGDYYGGNGGGGRIAVHYDPVAQAGMPRPPVRFSAYAWPWDDGNLFYGPVRAEMGTLYLTDTMFLASSSDGDALFDGQRFWHTRLYLGTQQSSWAPASLVISNCVIGFHEGYELDVAGDVILAGTKAPFSGATDGPRAALHLHARETNTLYGARLNVGRDLVLEANAWIYPHGPWYDDALVGIRVGRHVMIDETGGIDASETGFMPQSGNLNGPGAGRNDSTGGSYGGKGGGNSTAIREPYGRAALPLEPGSPGGWRARGGWTTSGAGGGGVHLLAGGTLSLGGTIRANGRDGSYYRGPGGSGGSVFLAGKRIQGAGLLQARGAVGDSNNGQGGGGRIAVWHHIPLAMVEKRIAARDVSGLAYSGDFPSFTGTTDAGVTASSLVYQPEPGTIGFYTIAGSLIILR